MAVKWPSLILESLASQNVWGWNSARALVPEMRWVYGTPENLDSGEFMATHFRIVDSHGNGNGEISLVPRNCSWAAVETTGSALEILGVSSALRRIMKQVEMVSPSGSTVLVLGETGTGKELIARAIHNCSPRRDRPFVVANCGSIPAGLLESELFGHERGAFTGAINRSIGRFELAHGGTIFLDEVGDIPLELQSKLLRVIQEQELERLGSSRTMRLDFRLVAATNKNLMQLIEQERFRSDLYYRLHVFPIQLPALRHRAEDIPLLVWHFAMKFAERMKKRIEIIRAEDMRVLVKYAWPGNVRELQNFVERSVILSSDTILHMPIGELRYSPRLPVERGRTLAEAEREHILQTLRETDWVVGGPDGAATRLAVKRTTLLDKMRRLGISRPAV